MNTACIVGFAWFLTQAIVATVEQSGSIATPILALIVIVALRAATVWATERISATAAARVGSQLRIALVDTIHHRGSAWLATRNSTSLTLTATRGLGALDAYFGRFLPQLVATVVTTPILIGVMWLADLPTAIAIVLTLPLIPLFMVLIGLATRTVQQTQWAGLQKLSVRFSDTVQGLSTLRIYGRAGRAADSVEQSSQAYRRATMKVLRVTFLSGFALELLASLAVAIVAVSVGLRMLSGDLDLWVGLFVLLLAPDAFFPLRQVGAQFHAATEGVEATREVLDLLDEQPGREVSTEPSPRGSHLMLSEVRVRYGDCELPPVSFAASPGTISVISGPSGSGKSSLFAALRGAVNFSGSAMYGGVSTAHLDPASWLAWAGQSAVLFPGSVAENVCLGESASAVRIAWSLQMAGAREISPATPIGEGGSGLSGGQAQRVAVARALYRWRSGTADVIALDEPSSALDAITEAALWQNLRSIAADGATILVISHRPSALAMADTVVDIAEVHA